MISTEERWLGDGGLAVHARRWEPEGEPRAVIGLVHGLGEHGGRYGALVEALTAAGIAVCAFDLRGHGLSSGRRGDTRFLSTFADIDRLLDDAAARCPGKPRYLLGHSLGGLLVLDYALARRPAISGVIASAPALRSPLQDQRAKVWVVQALASLLPGVCLPTGLDPAGVSRDPAVVEAYRSDPLVHGRASLGLARDALVAGKRVSASAARWSLPLLLLHGGADRITDPSATAAFAAGVSGDCRLVVYDDLYHELHHEPERALVFDEIVGWVGAR